jgi:hypothetical protein
MINSRTGLALIAAGAAMSALSGLIAQPAAAASAGNGICEAGDVCVFRLGRLVADIAPGRICTSFYFVYDQVWNRGWAPERAYAGAHCTGRAVLVPVGTVRSVDLFKSVGL